MTTETRRLHLTIDRLDAAARIWAAACSTTGAMAPDHIADVLSAQWDARQPIPDLSIAAVEGTRRASEENASYGHMCRSGEIDHCGPEPRGVDLRIQGGRTTALVWDTGGSHVISLRPVDDGRSLAWTVDLECTSDPATSPRVTAMLGAAWSWRDCSAEHLAEQREILALAAEVGIDVARLDGLADEQSARISHRFEPPTVAIGDIVTMSVEDDEDPPRVYTGTVRQLAPGGRRARVDWTGEVPRWASWYVDTADLTRQGWEARS